MLFLLPSVVLAQDWFVPNDGDGDGRSWVSAASLANALASADDGDVLWLAAGTYQGSTFSPGNNNLKLYGGFTVGMTQFEQRDWEANRTVLNGEGVRRVLSISLDGILLDGLVISNGFWSSSNDAGGGIRKSGVGSLTVANTVFCNNRFTGTGRNGGGGYFSGGSVTLTNCSFIGNIGAQYNRGGGFYATGVNLVVEDCRFSDNRTGSSNAGGGAFYVTGGTLDVRACVFDANVIGTCSTSDGGAVSLAGALSATFRNCVFNGNSGGRGGAIAVSLSEESTTTVENCTFANTNKAGYYGGAVFVGSGIVRVNNSILWNNSAQYGAEIYNGGGAISVEFCCLSATGAGALSGSVSMLSCITEDPLFAGGSDFHLQSSEGRWDPDSASWTSDAGQYSPCIDRGDPESDYSREPTEHGYRVNIGAYGNTPYASKSLAVVAPVVENRPAAVAYNTVRMNGELISGGQARVTICYGTSNGGTTIENWEKQTETLPSPRTGASFSVAVGDLMPDTLYYFRCLAFNAAGTNWAVNASTFTTGAAAPSGGPGIIHVNGAATGPETGRDWISAFRTIREGVMAVNGESNEIWIAQGHYVEGGTLSVNKSMSMYGGFAGVETIRSQRDLANAPVLDGEGLYSLIRVSFDGVVLDGLILSNSFSSTLAKLGAGVHKTDNGVLTLANITFTDNTFSGTGAAGGGGHFNGGSVVLTNCVFIKNSGGSYNSGAGFYANGTDLILRDCRFIANDSGGWDGKGGAIYVTGGTLDGSGCIFEKNVAGPSVNSGGGAVYATGALSPSFRNCVYMGNYSKSASGRGGALRVAISAGQTATVENCSFTETNRAMLGGAIFAESGVFHLKNNIFWNNNAYTTGHELYATGAVTFVTFSYSCFTGTNEPHVVKEGGAVIELNEGVITGDPLFAAAWDAHLRSRGGRWDDAVQGWVEDIDTSPCIDAGDPEDPVGGELRPNGRRINMGAYGGTAQASMTLVPRGSVFGTR